MNSNAERLLVAESDVALRDHIASVLSDAGYQVSTEYKEGMKAVLGFNPDVVILGADLPKLDCCDLLSEIKGSEYTRNIRVVMLSPGGSVERTRGLDLGADDVLSLPFEPKELLSRVRSQLRNKRIADQLRSAEANRSATQEVVAVVNEERKIVRFGALAIIALLVIVGLIAFFLHRRTQQQNIRVYAAISKLQNGMLTQQRLVEGSHRALDDRERPTDAKDPEKLRLQKKSEELRSQLASKTEDSSALQSQLAAVQSRLEKLETEGKAAQTIIQTYEPSVCLIHVVLAFAEHTTGLRLHYAGVPKTTSEFRPKVVLLKTG
jgi:DNA-binding response OmpR family regulator